jgi:hypothetical protein
MKHAYKKSLSHKLMEGDEMIYVPGNIKQRGTQATDPTNKRSQQLGSNAKPSLPKETKISRFCPPIPNATAAQKVIRDNRNKFLHHFVLWSSLPDRNLRKIPLSNIFVAGNIIKGALQYGCHQ